MIRKILIMLLASLALFSPANAQSVKAGAVAPNIRYISYDPNGVIRLVGHTGYQMSLEFDVGERIETVGIGDSSGWQVTPNGSGTVMFLKPVGIPHTTNMSIITNMRRYNLELVAKSGLRVAPSQVIYAVRFSYPPRPADAAANASAPPIIATPPELWNRAYSYDGAKANVPDQVFDDGKATYFRFTAGSATPAIFSITPDAGESIVNFAIRGPYVVVEQVAPQFVLRHGKEVTFIFNDAYAAPTPGADAPKARAKKKCGLFGCKSREAKP